MNLDIDNIINIYLGIFLLVNLVFLILLFPIVIDPVKESIEINRAYEELKSKPEIICVDDNFSTIPCDLGIKLEGSIIVNEV